MMDLLSEQRISMTELAHREKVAIPTIWRWRQKGIRGVRLESFMVGGRRFTTHEAFVRFVERTTKAVDGELATTKVRTNRQRMADIARAERLLDEAGI